MQDARAGWPLAVVKIDRERVRAHGDVHEEGGEYQRHDAEEAVAQCQRANRGSLGAAVPVPSRQEQ